MKRIAPIALALSLGARALFGNPLESTIIKEDTQKELDITGSVDNKSFSLDASLPMGDDWRINFASDMEYDDKIPIINSLDFALGNKIIYLGASYGDLSKDTILKDSYMLKIQTGARLFDLLDFSLTAARINIPNMRSQWLGNQFYETPLGLTAFAWNANLGKEFSLGDVSLFPWLSTIGSYYSADPVQTADLESVIKANPDYPIILMSYPFDHLNVKAGLELRTKLLDAVYEGTYEGNFYIHPNFNFINKIGINLHDEKRKNLSLDYGVSLITKPQFYAETINSPLRNELKFDVGGFGLFDNGFFLKGQFSALVDFLSPTQINATAAVGKKFDFGNLELYYNYPSNTLGLQYSSKLDKSVEKESRLRESFLELKSSFPSITSPYSPSLVQLHSEFGNTLEEALSKIHSEQDISRLLSLIEYRSHSIGAFTAKQQYEIYGWGDCEDTNGNLGVELEKVLGYPEVYAVSIEGAFFQHGVIIIKDKNGKFDVRDFENYYDLNAESESKAIEIVFPGAYLYGDGTTSTTVQTVRAEVEKPLYHWKD